MKTSIIILGTGCAKCKALESKVREVVSETGLEVKIEKVENLQEIVQFGVMSTPALVINGEIAVAGNVPSKNQIQDFLNTIGVRSNTQ